MLLEDKGTKEEEGKRERRIAKKKMAHLQISRDDFLMYEHFLRIKDQKNICYAERDK